MQITLRLTEIDEEVYYCTIICMVQVSVCDSNRTRNMSDEEKTVVPTMSVRGRKIYTKEVVEVV